MTDNVTQWDLSRAVLDGRDEAAIGMVEACRRYGARSVELGYRWHDDDSEPGPDDVVTWFAEVDMSRKVRNRRVDRVIVKERLGGPGHLPHDEAQLQAIADVIRELGGNVTVVHK